MQQPNEQEDQQIQDTKLSPNFLFVNQSAKEVWKREAPEHLAKLWNQKSSPQIAPLESRIHTYMNKHQESLRPKKVKLTTVFHDLINDVENVASFLKNKKTPVKGGVLKKQIKGNYPLKEIN